MKFFVSFRSSLAFERSSFKAFDGTEKKFYFFEGKNKILFPCNSTILLQFDCEEFFYGLAYLADIFGHLNEVNLSIQGPI